MDDGTREIRPGRAATTQPYEEEFLFHLSRGSELLVENRVERAKEELERALRYQPHDEKGQDLLASVYFRLGLYPRAIEIWERLARLHPGDLALRVNLGLVLLKTGQPEDARAHFQRATEIDPAHARAYRYLGLAEWRCGQLDRARESFLRGGEVTMARRMEEMLGIDESEAPEPAPPRPPSLAPPPPPSFASMPVEAPSSPSEVPPPDLEPSLAVAASGALVVRALARVCFRNDRLRARVGEPVIEALPRRDGAPSPFVRGEGAATLLVAPPEGLRLVELAVEDEPLFVIERHLEAWTGGLSHEYGRALADVDVVSLRGVGRAVLRVCAEPSILRLRSGERADVDPAALVGWTGRLLPDGTTSTGLLAFRGEGALLVL